MRILRLSCSPRGHASESYKLSQAIVNLLVKSNPAATVVNRELAVAGSVCHIDEDYATAVVTSLRPSEELLQKGSLFESEKLIQELEGSDYVVIGTPMHNFTVPSALKAWIDHIVRVCRTFNVTPAGKIGTLRDRPVFIAVSSGGKYSGEDARQPDFLTPYLRTVLGIIGLHDVTFFSIEGAAFAPDAVAEARRKANQKLAEHFSATHP
jgi:FMN-dependent NADH-azoreductase